MMLKITEGAIIRVSSETDFIQNTHIAQFYQFSIELTATIDQHYFEDLEIVY